MYKKIIFLLFLVQLFCAVPGICVSAAEYNPEIIRVGYYSDDPFFYEDNTNQYYGLYAEYLYQISQYTGWQYEFVSDSYDSLLSMLSDGSIDMLLNVSNTPEQRALCNFPDYPITTQQLCIVVQPDDTRFPNNSLYNLNGRKIGAISNTYSEAALSQLCDNMQLQYRYCPYLTYKDLMYAFASGSVDAVALNISETDESQQILSVFDNSDLYLAVSKSRPDLLEQLNQTLKIIYLQYPYYNSDLYKKYMGTQGKHYTFSPSSADYVDQTSILKVVYIKDNAPFEYIDTENNTLKGITGAYFSEIAKRSGLQFEYIGVENYTEGLRLLASKDADLIASLYADVLYAHSCSLNITDSYYNLGLSLVRKNDRSLNMHESLTIALPDTSMGIDEYLLKSYPYMQFYYYNNMEDCIEAVRTGSVAAAILPSETVSIFLQQHYYPDIVTSTGMELSVPVSIGIRPDLSAELLSILNLSLTSIPSADKQDILLENMVQTTYSVSFYNMLISNLPLLLIGIFSIAALLISVIIIRSKLMYDKALSVSEIDQSTSLLNKTSAESRMRAYLASRPQELCALYVIDIDYFKNINDTFGHICGDTIIKDVAALIKRTFLLQDIVGRMGGDEFIVLQVKCSNINEITERAKKLRNSLNRDYHFSPTQSLTLSASIGIKVYYNGNYTYDELMEQADHALYQVKEEGRNHYLISS